MVWHLHAQRINYTPLIYTYHPLSLYVKHAQSIRHNRFLYILHIYMDMCITLIILFMLFKLSEVSHIGHVLTLINII